METDGIAEKTTPKRETKRPVRDIFPKVYEFTKKRDSGNSYTYWMVDARSKKYGLDERPTFNSKKEALERAKEIADRLTKFGAEPEIEPEAKVRAEKYERLVERLAVYGNTHTPEDAVTHFLSHLVHEKLRAAKPTIRELVNQYEAYKLLEKRDEQYEAAIKLHCKFIRATWGDRKVDDLRKHEIDVTLTKQKPHKGTRKHYLTHIRMFFRWVLAEDKGYITTNPAFGIRYTPDKFAKEHFNAEQTKSLLTIVREIAPELIGYYSLLAFVGLRPSEGARVVWNDVNFETHQLRVNDESKTGERYCKLEPVALAWMRHHHEQGDGGKKPFIPQKSLVKPKQNYNLFNVEKDVREAFKEKHDGFWASDVLRHTAATHLVSLWEDEPKTAFYLGNSVATIKKHYAKRLPKSELSAFWGLSPTVVFGEK